MSAEKIKAKIDLLKEILRGLILFDLALISGIVTVIYQVLAQRAQIYMIIFSFIGFIIFIRFFLLTKKIYDKIDRMIEEEL